MKQHTVVLGRSDQIVLWGVLWLGLLIIGVSPLYGFLSTWLGTSLGPLLVWKAAKDISIAVIALLLCGWLMLDWRRRFDVFRSPLMVLVGLYFGVSSVVSLVHYHGMTQSFMAGVLFDTRYVVLMCVLYIAQYFLGDMTWRQYVKTYMIGVVIFLVAVGVVQVSILPADFLTHVGYGPETIAPVSTIDNNPEVRRAFATMRGPNDYGAFMVIALVVCVTLIRNSWLRYGMAAIATIGLYISGSRSAWLGAMAALMIVMAATFHAKLRLRRTVVTTTLLSVVAMGMLFYAALRIPAVRLAVFHSSPGDSHLTEGSTDLHWVHTADGIQRVMEDPFGCGVGCAGPASFYSQSARISENYYVQIAEEFGIIGLIAWLGLFGLVLRSLYGIRSDKWALVILASGVGLAFVGFWLHVWADDAVSLTWWGLAGLVIGQIASQNDKKALSLHEVHGKKENKKQATASHRISQAASRR